MFVVQAASMNITYYYMDDVLQARRNSRYDGKVWQDTGCVLTT